MTRVRYLIGVTLVAVTLLAVITSGLFVQGTSNRTHLVANEAYNDGVIQLRVNITVPQMLYERVPSPLSLEIRLTFPEGPMNVTVDMIEVGLCTSSGGGLSDTVLDSLEVVFSPELVFNNTQEVILQEEMTAEPQGSGASTTMSCYVRMEATNSTGDYALWGGPSTIESVPVVGWLLHPIVWIVVTAGSWIVSGLFVAWKHKSK